MRTLFSPSGGVGEGALVGKPRKFYVSLYNNEDISNSVEGMTEGVRLFCQETGCLRKFLHASMGGGSLGPVIPGWCCGPCSTL